MGSALRNHEDGTRAADLPGSGCGVSAFALHDGWAPLAFGGLPECIEFLERTIFQPTAAGVNSFFDYLETLHEFCGAAVQQFLGLRKGFRSPARG